ncbi:MAG: hypothetical protein ABTQ31_17220 [Rhizobiaceae bacterium]
MRTMGGLHLVETVHAMALPKGRPRTDDMRAMVEHMQGLGLVQRRPAAFQSGDVLYIHPALAAGVRKLMARRADSFMNEMFLGALRR